ncbi:hypothetical protein D9756_010662 [Leucocoprinus leucothites]|uniref:Uncharacterized protein n=1 Tax=Leucocoprinus leucothites TaxID=201217 RepID=A0A8H5FS47_9AGAR|nr:hypothetical protein D9756_010662 [Leucoagaricus leucothites]
MANVEANASNHWTRSLALKLGGKLPPSNSFALQNATYTTASSTTTFSSSPSFLIREFTGQNGLDTDLRPNFQQQQLNIVAHSTRCLRNPSCFAISAHFELIGLTNLGYRSAYRNQSAINCSPYHGANLASTVHIHS